MLEGKRQINLGSANEEGCMTSVRSGLGQAAKDTLLGGKPLTRLEAMVLFGVANLPAVVRIFTLSRPGRSVRVAWMCLPM